MKEKIIQEKKSQGYFPLFIDLTDKKVLIFGGGTIATRRVLSLLEFGTNIKIVAPEVSLELIELEKSGEISIERREYTSGEINDCFMVLGATDNKKVNLDIYEECKRKKIIVNISSDQSKCDFFFPGIIKEKNLVIGVTASGKDHKMAKEVTKKIRNFIS